MGYVTIISTFIVMSDKVADPQKGTYLVSKQFAHLPRPVESPICLIFTPGVQHSKEA